MIETRQRPLVRDRIQRRRSLRSRNRKVLIATAAIVGAASLISLAVLLVTNRGCAVGAIPLLSPERSAVWKDLKETFGSNPVRIKKWFPPKPLKGSKKYGQIIDTDGRSIRVQYEVYTPAFGWGQRDMTFLLNESGEVIDSVFTEHFEAPGESNQADY